jgi:hypothetical protein
MTDSCGVRSRMHRCSVRSSGALISLRDREHQWRKQHSGDGSDCRMA